jgi:hypothetical protein
MNQRISALALVAMLFALCIPARRKYLPVNNPIVEHTRFVPRPMRVGTTIVVPFWLAVFHKSDYLRILQPVSLKVSVVNPEPMSILPSQADCSIVDIKSPYRIVSGQSDEWRLLFFVRLAIEAVNS